MENHDQPKESQTDFYQILGVSQEATLEEITRKYHQLSKLYHPDKEGGDVKKFLEIKKAYKILKNPQKRQMYNDSLSATFNQLKGKERDTTYHVNEKYMTTNDKTGQLEFDHQKFINAFEASRKTNEELIQETEPAFPTRSLDDILADRDRDLEQFRSNQRTDLTTQIDPSTELGGEIFNNVFKKYSKMQSTQLQEMDDKIIWGYRGDDLEVQEEQKLRRKLEEPPPAFEALNLLAQQDKTVSTQIGLFQKNFEPAEGQTINSLLSQTTQEFEESLARNQLPERVTNEPSMDLSQIKKKLMAYNEQTKDLAQPEIDKETGEKKPFFKVTIKDDDKLRESDEPRESGESHESKVE